MSLVGSDSGVRTLHWDSEWKTSDSRVRTHQSHKNASWAIMLVRTVTSWPVVSILAQKTVPTLIKHVTTILHDVTM